MKLPHLSLALITLFGGSRVLGRAAEFTPVDYEIRLDTIRSGFDGEYCWFHPRAGLDLTDPVRPGVVLTMQKWWLKISDAFYALHDIRTDDGGRTWSEPREHGETLGRRAEPHGIEVVASDFWPQWHAASGKLLGIGHTVRYLNDRVHRDSPRQTVYSVYDSATRTWSAWVPLEMPDGERFYNIGAGSVQRVDLPNGDILLPAYGRPREGTDSRSIVMRCRFDGEKLTVVELGNELTVAGGRGLGEPSLARFQGRYYLTLRNDEAGYVATSTDGLHFGPPQLWTWDDGTDLGTYNTQQHWVTHREGLFLVYTRRGGGNDHVVRHRAPLFIGQVDTEKLAIRRETERVLIPERGAGLGNFGVTEISPEETWVTAAEAEGINRMKLRPDHPLGPANNSVYAARIRWKAP